MQIIFPGNILNPKEPDEEFLDQIKAFEAAGYSTSLCSIEQMMEGKKGLYGYSPDLKTLYRGWMLSPEQYTLLNNGIRVAGGSLLRLIPA